MVGITLTASRLDSSHLQQRQQAAAAGSSSGSRQQQRQQQQQQQAAHRSRQTAAARRGNPLRATRARRITRAPAANPGRSLWDPALITEGFEFLKRSARGSEPSRFHIEAGIAVCHAKATSFANTNWQEIVSLYDFMRVLSPSPVVEVNRAFAIGMAHGALAGIDELDAIPERDLLAHYPYALATYAELHASRGDLADARAFLDKALAQQSSPAEHALLRRKRAALGD